MVDHIEFVTVGLVAAVFALAFVLPLLAVIVGVGSFEIAALWYLAFIAVGTWF